MTSQSFYRRPSVIPDTVTHLTTQNQEVRAKFAAYAAKDWEQILLMRGKELVSGKYIHTPSSHTHELIKITWSHVGDRLESAVVILFPFATSSFTQDLKYPCTLHTNSELQTFHPFCLYFVPTFKQLQGIALEDKYVQLLIIIYNIYCFQCILLLLYCCGWGLYLHRDPRLTFCKISKA